MNKKILFAIVVFFGPLFTFAQEESDLGSIELNVIDRYKGRIAEAVKISRNANFIDTSIRKLPVRYEVPIETRQFTFRPKPLTPMTISKVPVKILPHYHLDLGFGLNGFFSAHASVSSDRSARRQWGIEFDHWNIRSGVSDIIYDNSPHFKNRLEGHLKSFLGQRKWSFQNRLALGSEGLRYYGIPTDEAPKGIDFDGDAMRQAYYNIAWDGRLKNLSSAKKANALDEIGASYSFFFDRFQSQEHEIKVDQESHIDLSGERLNIGSRLDYIRSNFDSVNGGSRLLYDVGLMPSISSSWGDFRFKLGVQLGLYGRSFSLEDEATNEFYLLPDFEAEYSFVPTYLSAFVNWKGNIQAQSYRELTNRNPFISPGVNQEVSRQSSLEGGFRGRIIDPLSFRVLTRYTLADDMPLFYRNPFYATPPFDPALVVLYDAVDIFTLRGEMRYAIDDWTIDGWMEFNTYDTDSLRAAYHLAELRFGLAGQYRISNRIETGLGMQFVGERTAYDQQFEPLTGRSGKLDPYLDLHLNLTYHYNEYLEARLNLDNIFANSYEIWLGYPSVGFQGSLTLSYRF
jgi:hypothetical protein